NRAPYDQFPAIQLPHSARQEQLLCGPWPRIFSPLPRARVTTPLRSGTALRDSTAARQTIKPLWHLPRPPLGPSPSPSVVPLCLPVVRFFLRFAPVCKKKTPHRADKGKNNGIS